MMKPHVMPTSVPTTPQEALFLHPQCNTGIELTYNQNQKGVL